MNIERTISLIRKRVKFPIHEEVIREALTKAYNSLMTEEARSGNLTPFRKNYTIEIQKDSDDIYYSDLPIGTLSIKDNLLIYTKNKKDIDFIPIEDGELAVFNNLDVSLISSTILYEINGRKIYYYNIGDEFNETQVRASIVPDISELPITDDVYVPMNLDEVLIETAVNFLSGTPPVTNINDSSELT